MAGVERSRPASGDLDKPPFDRVDYPTLATGPYLNQASLGLVGTPAVSAMHRYIDEVARHGNLHLSDEEEVAFLDGLRDRAARLLSVDGERVAVLSGASELLSQIPLLLFGRHRGHREDGENTIGTVVAVESDFPAVTRPWLQLAEQGRCQVDFVTDQPGADLTAALIDRIDERTSVVTAGTVQYATGTTIDVAAIRDAATAVGARVVIDATQAAGAMAVPAADWAVDVVVSSGYKWLGGHGGVAIGVVTPSLLELAPPMPGWMGAPSPFDFDATLLSFADDARRYTQSTMSYVSVVGLTAAIDELLEVGTERIEANAERLAGLLVDRVEPLGWQPFRPPGDRAASSHIVCLGHPRHRSDIVVEQLRGEGITCSTRVGRLRISLAPYNSRDDIDTLVAALSTLPEP